MTERVFDTIVVGGGQTGLTVGYHLARTGRPFVILDASERVGDAWRKRWDSLVLFTPHDFYEIPGMVTPPPPDHFPTKDEAADLVEKYAKDQGLPVLSGGIFLLETPGETFRARNVVVAMANFQKAKVPLFADELDPAITQLHSSDYRNPGQLPDGPILVVGMGNSGADIGLDLARDRETYVSGRPSMVIPFRIDSWFGRRIGRRLVRFFATRLMTTSTPIGRRARPKMMNQAAPVVRSKPKDIVAAGGEIVPRVTGVRNGLPELADGRILEVAGVVWCTGFQPGFDWIDLPIYDEIGRPRHERGISSDVPGLYFCGLSFQHALWSETVVAMPRDAKYVVDRLDKDDNRQPASAGTASEAFH
jgi:putative flavoprotein involved in K+ transport